MYNDDDEYLEEWEDEEESEYLQEEDDEDEIDWEEEFETKKKKKCRKCKQKEKCKKCKMCSKKYKKEQSKKVSDITINELADFLRLDYIDKFLEVCLISAKNYMCTYTNLKQCEIDKISELVPICLILAGHFYEERGFESSGKNSFSQNKLAENILAMHRIDFL